MNKHKDETMIRIFLNTHLSAVVMKEVEAIKEEDFKSIELLAKETKL